MKGGWRRYTLLGIAAYAVFLALTMPAQRLYALAQGKLDNVRLWELSGSALHGHAAIAQIGARRLEDVEWRLQPWALLLGRLQAATRFRTEQGPAEMVVGRGLGGSWYIRDARLDLPAAVLEPVFHLAPGQLGGHVGIHLEKLAYGPSGIKAAAGTLTWKDAALTSPWPTSFGMLELTLEETDKGYKGVLQDRGGLLNAQGLLTLKPDGSYDFTATLAPRDKARAPQLENGLRILGVPQPDGRYKITTAGRLPLPAAHAT